MGSFKPLTAEEWRYRLGVDLDERELPLWNALAWCSAHDRRLYHRWRRWRLVRRIRRLGLER